MKNKAWILASESNRLFTTKASALLIQTVSIVCGKLIKRAQLRYSKISGLSVVAGTLKYSLALNAV